MEMKEFVCGGEKKGAISEWLNREKLFNLHQMTESICSPAFT